MTFDFYYRKSTKLWNAVLDNWDGKPEDLGALVEQATTKVYRWQKPEDRIAEGIKIKEAKEKLCSIKGGEELFIFELGTRDLVIAN